MEYDLGGLSPPVPPLCPLNGAGRAHPVHTPVALILTISCVSAN